MHVGNPEQTQQVIFTRSFAQMYMQQQWVKKRRPRILEREVGMGKGRRRKERGQKRCKYILIKANNLKIIQKVTVSSRCLSSIMPAFQKLSMLTLSHRVYEIF